MNNNEIYKSLEETFAATFMKELIPGILHNFANPLNGIIGRTKLLARRIEENSKKMKEMYPDAATGLMEETDRLKADIRAVSQESEYFHAIFKDISAKFYALATKGEDNINISQLVDAEVRFFDFNLNFKHEVVKKIQLDKDIPDFQGNKAELSMAFWALIRFAMSRAQISPIKEVSITTEHDQKYVSIFIKSSGAALPAAAVDTLMERVNSGSREMPDSVIDEGVLDALLILNRYNARVNMFSEDNFTTISIGIPYGSVKPKRKEI